jgi:hypothetical protein
MIKGLSDRYERECRQLGELARKQLNLEKNKCKEDFEDMSINAIFKKIDEEVNELKYEFNSFNINKKVNYERVTDETGDISACLAGLLAWISKQRAELNDDGA